MKLRMQNYVETRKRNAKSNLNPVRRNPKTSKTKKHTFRDTEDVS